MGVCVCPSQNLQHGVEVTAKLKSQMARQSKHKSHLGMSSLQDTPLGAIQSLTQHVQLERAGMVKT